MTSEPQTLIVGSGAEARPIAYRATRPRRNGAPSVFWLSGFMSDMASTKATALAAYASEKGLGSTLLDYSGHGVSGGAFKDGTIGRWLEEAEAVFTQVSEGEQIVVGSSMGGHIALLLLRKLLAERPADAARVKGLVLIAPAWDMTEELMWKKFPDEARRAILETGVYMEPSDYDAPYMITRALIEEGRKHLIAPSGFDPGRPVVILQGLQDKDVPAEHTRQLLVLLKGGRVDLIEIADGEHRLSRPQDLEKLYSAVERFA
jgi:pimeloyl-ACP methyl ester carboxylesterase